jgi:hypothetical protein
MTVACLVSLVHWGTTVNGPFNWDGVVHIHGGRFIIATRSDNGRGRSFGRRSTMYRTWAVGYTASIVER